MGIPTYGEGGGGGQAGWAKFPTFTENLFWKLPLLIHVIKQLGKELLYQSLGTNRNHSKRKMFLPQLSKGIGQRETRLIAEVI